MGTLSTILPFFSRDYDEWRHMMVLMNWACFDFFAENEEFIKNVHKLTDWSDTKFLLELSKKYGLQPESSTELSPKLLLNLRKSNIQEFVK